MSRFWANAKGDPTRYGVGAILIIAVLAMTGFGIFQAVSDDSPEAAAGEETRQEQIARLFDGDGTFCADGVSDVELAEVGVPTLGSADSIRPTWAGEADYDKTPEEILQASAFDLFAEAQDGCTISGAVYWRNIDAWRIDPWTNPVESAGRYDRYSDDQELSLAVSRLSAETMSTANGEWEMVSRSINSEYVVRSEIFMLVYTADYEDVVVGSLPTPEEDTLPDGSKGLRLIAINHDGEGDVGDSATIYFAPSLRALVWLDAPAGVETVVFSEEADEEVDLSVDFEAVTPLDEVVNTGGNDNDVAAPDVDDSADDTTPVSVTDDPESETTLPADTSTTQGGTDQTSTTQGPAGNTPTTNDPAGTTPATNGTVPAGTTPSTNGPTGADPVNPGPGPGGTTPTNPGPGPGGTTPANPGPGPGGTTPTTAGPAPTTTQPAPSTTARPTTTARPPTTVATCPPWSDHPDRPADGSEGPCDNPTTTTTRPPTTTTRPPTTQPPTTATPPPTKAPQPTLPACEPWMIDFGIPCN